MPKEDMERLNFWVSRELADAVRQKLLDHKRATRERITITDICTEALQKFITPKEGNEMISIEIKNGIAKLSVNNIKGTVKIIPVIPGDGFKITPSHYLKSMGMFYFVSENPLGGYDITEGEKPDCRGPILFHWID